MPKQTALEALDNIFGAQNLKEKTIFLYKYAMSLEVIKPGRLYQIEKGENFDQDEVLIITKKLAEIAFRPKKFVTIEGILV